MSSQGTTDRFQILSLDGGGLRGLFSAALLAAVEEDLNTTITEHFDLIAGTSTGGIIALGLGLGLSPKALVEFYVAHGPRIFSNALGLRSLQRWLIRRKYPLERLEKSLRSVFGDRLFGASAKRTPGSGVGADAVDARYQGSAVASPCTKSSSMSATLTRPPVAGCVPSVAKSSHNQVRPASGRGMSPSAHR